MFDIETYNARRTAMIAKQEELRLLLPPEGAIRKHDVDVYLDQVDAGTENVMTRLRGILTPYALACHSALTDKRQRLNELLYIGPLKKEVPLLVFPVVRLMGLALNRFFGPWEKEEMHQNPRIGTIKFAQMSRTQGYNVFASMEYREVQPKGMVDYLCRRVVFCEAPEDNIRSASNKYFLANADDDHSLSSLAIIGVPNYINYLVELYFDYSGSIKAVTHLDKDGESLIMYRFNKKGFDVRRYIGVQRGGWDAERIKYNYFTKDENFRKQPLDSSSPTIEEDVLQIMSLLPLEQFK